MTPEQNKQEPDRTQQGNPRSPRTKHRSSLFGYLVILFLAAFILLLMSYFMQQRRNDQALIDGLQQSISAMQAKQNLSDQNKALITQNNELLQRTEQAETAAKQLETQLETLTGQAQTLETENKQLKEDLSATQEALAQSEQTTLALDWLWRIEREYFKGRYSAARELIEAFRQAGLEDALPNQPLVDPEYRTPRAQYDSIVDVLF